MSESAGADGPSGGAPGAARGTSGRHRRPFTGPPESSRFAVALRAPLAAITLLTILPVPARAQRRIGAREVAASAPFFPLVGALLGLAIGSVAHQVAEQSTQTLGAAVAVILLAALTGALHLDGLADSADALGARGGSRERRLEIMRDSSTGAYGTAAVAGWFVLMASAIAALPSDQLAVVLAWALALSRGLAVAHARALPPARPEGLGAGFAMSTAALVSALVVVVLVGTALAALPVDGGALSSPPARIFDLAALASLIVYVLVLFTARRLIGGRTGDTLGASIALVEAAALLGAALATG